jgi:MSHA pilin protein MshD
MPGYPSCLRRTGVTDVCNLSVPDDCGHHKLNAEKFRTIRETLNKFAAVIASAAKQSMLYAKSTTYGLPRRFAPRNDGLNKCFPKPAYGFTLIELIIFIVIISVGLAGVLLIFDTVTRRSADPVRAKQAIAVAEGMLDEIMNKSFCDPDTVTLPAPGTSVPATCGTHTTEATRDLYDDVDDYIGYNRTGVRDVASDATVVLAGYNVTVTVTMPAPGSNFVVGANTITPTDYRIVTVTVSDTVGNQSYAITGYKFKND